MDGPDGESMDTALLLLSLDLSAPPAAKAQEVIGCPIALAKNANIMDP